MLKKRTQCDRICVPRNLELIQLILNEAHNSRLSVYPRSTKMYQDLKQHYSLLASKSLTSSSIWFVTTDSDSRVEMG
ncbi:Gag protease polyprotein [Gossypium australe]|uniref:Gag protease polyprotein n=1 Tax=Gossypium australe TaxID=47621 RepID=A0A5B6VVW0_9ROSI|nr:Gag protease polyprotein [Gossypium australe]